MFLGIDGMVWMIVLGFIGGAFCVAMAWRDVASGMWGKKEVVDKYARERSDLANARCEAIEGDYARKELTEALVAIASHLGLEIIREEGPRVSVRKIEPPKPPVVATMTIETNIGDVRKELAALKAESVEVVKACEKAKASKKPKRGKR